MIYELRKRVIYKIESPTKRIYVGQSCKWNNRKSSYKNLHCKDQPKIYNSLLKYGYNNHKIELLYEGNTTQDAIDELEIVYIKYYNSNSSKHLNLCSGGKGHTGHLHTQESKDKMSKAKQGYIPWNVGIPLTEEQKNKMSNTVKEKYSDKTKHPFYGKSHSEETKEKIRIGLAKYRENKKYAEQVNNDI